MVKDNNIRSYEYLFHTNRGLVYLVARRFNVDAFVRDDLIQVGLMGLLKAAEKYDISRGYQFTTFAIPYILGAMRKELQTKKIIKTSYSLQRIKRMVANCNPQMTLEEMAKECHTSIDQIILAISKQDEVQYLADEMLEKIESHYLVCDTFNTLSPQEKVIWQMYFQRKMTQTAIAKQLQMSQSKVSRDVKTICQKIKTNIY